MEEIPSYLYDALIGSRYHNGELHIAGFTEEDYEGLWELLMNEIIIPLLKRRDLDYYHFLGQWAVRYGRKRNNNRFYDGYDPLTANRPDTLTTRQQLAIIKYYMTHRRNSGFAANL